MIEENDRILFTIEIDGKLSRAVFQNLSHEQRKEVLINRSESFLYNLINDLADELKRKNNELEYFIKNSGK